jgi:hypothetical protein
MAEVKTGDPVEFLDLLLNYFADETRWTQGDLDDGRGRRCLVGAIHYLRRRHQLSSRVVEDLLQEALPPGHWHLALFNDCCANIAELRGLIAKARTLAAAVPEEPRRQAAATHHGRWRILARFKHARGAAGDRRATAAPARLAA